MQEPNEITIYVAENGDDSNDGSKEAPFASVNEALLLLTDTTYEQAVIVVSGSITEVASKEAMIDITEYQYPPIIFKGESPNRKGILDAGGLERRVMFIGNKNTVTLGPNIILRGGYTDQTGGSGVCLNEGSLILDGGKVINNETKFGLCGGIYVGKASSFVMRSGCVMKNSSLFNGGGVFPDEGGTFTMYGGIIADNTAYISGAGVFVGVDGTFIMYDGVIDNNKVGGDKAVALLGLEVPYGKGGGVFVCDRGSFTMYKGEIRNNRALSAKDGDESGSGGGVFVEQGGSFTLEDGKIVKNGVMNFGGGVYAAGKFTLQKGCISNNSARVGGGGVCVASKNGNFVMQEGEISNNYGDNGGGVCTREKGVFRMEKGLITNNDGTRGTALFINSSASMLGGSICENGGKKVKDVLVAEQGTFIVSGGDFKAALDVKGHFEDTRKETSSKGTVKEEVS